MSSPTLYRLSGISLLLGAVVSVIAGVMTLLLDSSLSASPTTNQGLLWATFWSLAFVVLVLVLLGLPALSLRQARGRGGVVGFIGAFLVALGSFLGMATTAYFVSIAPRLPAKAPISSMLGTRRTWTTSVMVQLCWGSSGLFCLG
jgi:hypothetical protein